MAAIEVDLRALRDKVDDAGTQSNAKDSIAAANRSVVLYIAFAAVMLGGLARGFGWI